MQDLETIAFHLQPLGLKSFDSLAGDTLESKARSLVVWCLNHNFLNVLDFVIKKERPDI